MINNVFATNIMTLRVKREWSQEDLADFLNVTRQAVSKWENGSSIPDIEILLKLSKLFSVTINELFEKVVKGSVKSIDEIVNVETGDIRNVLKNYSYEEIIKASKGLSPCALNVVDLAMSEVDFKEAVRNFRPVKLTEVEEIHIRILNDLNLYLIGKKC